MKRSYYLKAKKINHNVYFKKKLLKLQNRLIINQKLILILIKMQFTQTFLLLESMIHNYKKEFHNAKKKIKESALKFMKILPKSFNNLKREILKIQNKYKSRLLHKRMTITCLCKRVIQRQVIKVILMIGKKFQKMKLSQRVWRTRSKKNGKE